MCSVRDTQAWGGAQKLRYLVPELARLIILCLSEIYVPQHGRRRRSPEGYRGSSSKAWRLHICRRMPRYWIRGADRWAAETHCVLCLLNTFSLGYTPGLDTPLSTFH